MEEPSQLEGENEEPERILARVLATDLADEALSAFGDDPGTMSTLVSTNRNDCEDK